MEKELINLVNLKDKQSILFDKSAQILAALSAPVRLKIVHFLSQSSLSVEVLAEKIDQSVANTSMHLQKLSREGIVSVLGQGQKRLYSLHPAGFVFWEYCQDFIAEINPSIKLNTDKEEDLNWNHSIEETLEMLQKNLVIILDVRPDDELKNSISFKNKNYWSIPSNNLKANLKKLPKKKKILVMCRGRMCALSLYSVNLLREHNLKAFRFQQSWFALKEFL